MSDPLQGIRVLDLSRVLAGPQCASMLGDLGAEVVKVEVTGGGDESRSWEPSIEGESTAFMAVNRNKRSMAVDLSTERGRRIVRELMVRSDVVIENFRTGTMDRWGLGYDQVKDDAPRLVYASVSAFGTTGELAGNAGYEAVLQAFSGIMSITGEPDGMPVRAGVSILDIGTGIVTAHAVTAALLDRERTGAGQRVETSLLATATTFLSYHAQGYLSAGEVPQRRGSGHPAVVPYRAYACAGGDAVFVAAANQNLWQRFCQALDLAHLLEDQRFTDLPQRREHREVLDELIGERMLELSRAEIMRRLDAAGVPSAPVNRVDEVLDHPQVREVAAIRSIHDDRHDREVELLASPLRGSRMNTDIRSMPPRLGEHTDEVLRELGFDDDAVRGLREDGVVG